MFENNVNATFLHSPLFTGLGKALLCGHTVIQRGPWLSGSWINDFQRVARSILVYFSQPMSERFQQTRVSRWTVIGGKWRGVSGPSQGECDDDVTAKIA